MQSACQSPRTVCRLLEAPKATLLCGEFLMPVSDHLQARRVQVGKEEAHDTQSAEIRETETSTAEATGGQGEEPGRWVCSGLGSGFRDAAACSLEVAPSALGPKEKPPLLPSPAH